LACRCGGHHICDLAICSNLLPIKIEKTVHGISDIKEKTNPKVPAVEGIVIKIPAINPQVAKDLLKPADLYMVTDIISSVMALNT